MEPEQLMPEAFSQLELPDGRRLAYRQSAGRGPTVLFLGGFQSDMEGSKAAWLSQQCRSKGIGYTRFDYTGHGHSSGRFEDGTIGSWLDDALQVIDRLTNGPLLLVGSSMGGWISLLATLSRPQRIAGLVTIACATDFTQRLLWPALDPEQQRQLEQLGQVLIPSDYSDAPYPISRQLLEEGRQHLLLEQEIPLQCPVRMLHGLQDPDVPWQISLETCQQLRTRDAQLLLIKDGDHRLSREQDLHLLWQQTEHLYREIAGP